MGGSRPLQTGDLVKLRTWHHADNDWVILDDAGLWSVIAIDASGGGSIDSPSDKDEREMITIMGPYGIAEVMSIYTVRYEVSVDD